MGHAGGTKRGTPDDLDFRRPRRVKGLTMLRNGQNPWPRRPLSDQLEMILESDTI